MSGNSFRPPNIGWADKKSRVLRNVVAIWDGKNTCARCDTITNASFF